jgi:hypothetical protein
VVTMPHSVSKTAACPIFQTVSHPLYLESRVG